VCKCLYVCVSWVSAYFPHSCQSHIPLFCCLSLSSCLPSGFPSLSLFSTLFHSPQPPPQSYSFSLSLSFCISVSVSLLYSGLQNCCCMCARFFYSLNVPQKTTRTHMVIAFVWSYTSGHYPWNRVGPAIRFVFSPPAPSPPSFFRCSLALSVTQSLSLSRLSARSISCAYAQISVRFFGSIKVSFVDMYMDLLRIYKGPFCGYMQGSFSLIYRTDIYIYINV